MSPLLLTTPNSLKLPAAALLALLLGVCGCRPASDAPTPQSSPAAASATTQTPESPAERKAMHAPYTRPAVQKHIYPPVGQAAADVAGAQKLARAQGKRVLLDFGGDWCGDCQVLDIYFRQEPNASLLRDNFVKVNVNIGHEDANVELAHRYGVPLQGVPALAVLASDGKLLYSQNKEFSDMRYMEPTYVTEFLTKWKPGPAS